MSVVRVLVFPIFCGLFGALGLWVGVTSVTERSPRTPLFVAYEARVRAREKDPAYSSMFRKWWWVVDVRFADGSSRSFRQAAPRGLQTRFSPGEAVRVCSVEWRIEGAGTFRGLEIDDWLVRNFDTATALMLGVAGIAMSILLPVHDYQRKKAGRARETPAR